MDPGAYADDLSVNVKRGLATRARKGRPPSSPGYGYQREGERERMRWVIEPREAELARRVLREFADNGRSFSGIAKLLNREGVPSRKGACGHRA